MKIKYWHTMGISMLTVGLVSMIDPRVYFWQLFTLIVGVSTIMWLLIYPYRDEQIKFFEW